MDTVVQKKLNQILNKETTITSVANELGVSRQTLYKWLNQYKRQRGFPIFETQQKSHKAHNKISKDIEDLVISTAKNNPNDSVSTLATKLVTTYGVQLNPTTIFRVLKRNNIRYTPAVVPVRAPTALYVPETIPVSTELPTAKLSQDVLPHVAPTQLLSVTKAATVPTSALSPHALALPSYFLRQLTALVLVGVFGVVSLYGAYQFDGNTSSFTSGEPTASPNFEVASKVVSVFDEVNPSPLSPSTFSLTSLTDSLASLVQQGPRIAKLSLLPLETYQSFALGGYTVQAQRTPNITNANAASFLDRLSLTVFCSLAANKDASRCSYDTLLALRGTPDTTTILGYPVEQTPVAVATSTPSTTQPSPRIVYVPQYITNYVTEYVLGTPGKDGKDGKDGTTTTLVNNTSIPSGFGSYSIPSVTSPSLIGATTIGYLRDATIEKATVSDSIFNGYNLFNNTAIFTGFVGINSLAATTSVLTNATITTSTTTDAFISNLSSTNNLFTNATTTNSYISSLVASSSTLTDALLTNSTTTRAYIANLIASSSTLQDALLTNATTTNAYIQNLVAASSSVTDALFTNATTTNFVATNATSTSLFAQALTAVSSFFTNLTATNATTTNLIATNATSTNLFAGTGFVTNLTTTAATSTNLFSTNAFFTNLDATNINLGNATTTNFVATNATTTSLFTQNLAVGNATTQGNQTVNGDLTVNGTTTIAGNITLGTSTATYVSFNGLINSNVIPAANKMYDLGSPSFYWRDLYADNINVNTISAASTTISGTSNNTFSINSDNASTDAEDVSLIFFRGLVTPNALLRWNATTKRLESNMSFKVQNETPITGTTTLTVQAGAGQGTTNLLEVKNIGGTNLTVIDANGRVGIGSSTPSNPLTVIGNSFLGGNVTATGTISSPDAVITNATSTFFAAVNATTTNATTTRAYITSLVAASSTLQDALTTRSTTTDAYITRLVAASSTLQDAIVTTLNATNATVTSLLATNATTTNFASTNATSTNFFASVLNAVSAVFNSLTSGSITATSSLTSNGTLNVTGQTTLTTASSTGLTATNLYGTNATLTNATSTNFFTSLLNAVTAGFTNLTTTGTTTLATGGGRVGVGTGSPLGKLQVVTTSSDGNVATWGDGQFVVGQSGNTGGLGVSYDTSLNSSFISSLAPGIDWKDLGFRANNYNFFVNGGTQVMKITNTGNVGVGTTTPSAKLDINSSGTAVNIYDTVTSNIRLSIGTAGSPDFRASLQTYQHNTGGILGNLTLQENGGNVGIGTTSPTQKLEVQQGNIRINSPDQSLARLQINNTGISGREYALVSGVPNVGQTGFTLYDMTANASRLVVDAAGNVGMGTVSPEGRLTISGGSLASTGDAGHALSISSGLTTGRLLGGGSAVVSSLHTYYDSNAVEVTAGSTAGHVSGITIGARSYNGTAGSDAVALWTRNTQRLTVDATGNVGIGTTNPGAKLDINGNLSINAQHAIDFTNLNPNLRVIGVGEITIGDDDSVILSPQAGNVGIGTTNPAFTSGTGLEIERNGTATLRLDSQVYGTELRGLTNGTELMQLSAGYLALGTANTERMRIDSTGNIGVGTGSPQEKVDVVGSVLISAANANDNDSPGFIGVSNDDFLYNGLYLNHYGLGFHDPTQSANLGAYFSGYGGIDLFTSGANRVSIVENGNVGIGTTNPTAKLDISSAAANTPIIKLTSQEAGGDGYFMNFGYGSINHDSAGAVYTNWGSHYNGTTNAWVRDYTGLPLVNTQLSTSGDFVVNTDTATSGTPSFSSRFIVANNGNVGIGTTNPRAKLDILNSAALNRVLIRSSAANAANNGGSVDFHGVYTSGGTDVVPLASIAGRKVNGVSSDVQGYLQFNVTNTFGTPNEVMRIVGDLSGGTGGNVGIGTTTPGAKLQIDAGSYNANNRVLYVKNSNHAIVNTGYDTAVIQQNDAPTLRLVESGENLSTALSSDSGVSTLSSSGILRLMAGGTYNSVGYSGMGGNLGLAVAANGFVGVGTTTPGQRFSVYEPSNTYTAIGINNASANPDSRNWSLVSNFYNYGDFSINQSAALHGDPVLSGAVSRLLISPAGNIGIGTTTPTAALSIAGDGQALFGPNVGWGMNLRIGGSGGTSFPDASVATTNGNLHIDPASGGFGTYLNWYRGTSGVFFGNGASGQVGSIDGAGKLSMRRLTTYDTTGFAGTKTYGVGDGYGLIMDSYYTGAGAPYVRNADIVANTDNALDTAQLRFLTKPLGSSAQVSMLISADGNVGIGVNNPSAKLQVSNLATSTFEGISIQASYNSDSTKKSLTWRDGSNITGSIDTRYDGTTVDMVFGSLYNNGYNTTDRMTIKGNGNVGIGTTNPGTRLDIRGPDSLPVYVRSDDVASYIRFLTSNTVSRGAFGYNAEGAQFFNGALNATNMTILDGGNVGIGTTNPSLKLEVTAGAGLTPLALTSGTERWEVGQNAGAGSSDNSFGFYSSTYGAGHSYAPIMTMLNTGNVGIGATIPTAKLDIYNSTNAEMRLSTLSDGYLQMGQFTNGAYIGTSSSDPTDGVLRFGTAGSERVRVGSTGNVGIGSTDPADKLTVQGKVRLDYGGALGTSARYGNLVMSGNEGFSLIGDGTIPTTPGSDINFGPNQGYGQGISANWYYDGSTFHTYSRDGGSASMVLCTQNVGDCGAGDFLFKTAGVGTAGTSIGYSTPLVIKQGGNVGIGTTNPSYKLDVNGTIRNAGYLVGVDTLSGGSIKYLFANDGGGSFINSGNFGVGTSTPSSKLTVVGNITTADGGNFLNSGAYMPATTNASVIMRPQNPFSSSGNAVLLSSSTYTNSNSTLNAVAITPVYNQTSTAGAIDLYINRTETAIGSGTHSLIEAAVAGNTKFRVSTTGQIYSDAGTTITSPADYAESYSAMEALDAGTIVAFSTSTVAWSSTHGTNIARASSTDVYSISGVRKAVSGAEAIGIVSTNPGVNLGADVINAVPIALSGRVPVKVTEENGVVRIGDSLTVSLTRPGYAMKLTTSGRSIGRAISDHIPGQEKVMVYVENGYKHIDTTSQSATTTMLTSGNLALDANGVAIINIKSLSSANGTWSIDEHGRIVAKALCIDGTCLDGPGFKDLVEGGSGASKNGAMHIIGAHAFLLSATTHTLRVLDIAAGDNPIIVASLSLPEGVASLSANGTYLYVNNSDLSMLYIVDVTSPTQPTLLRSINTGLATEIVTPPGVSEDTSDDTATSTDEGGAEEDVPLVESEPETEPEVVEGESETEESPLTEEEPVNTGDNAPLSSLDSPETTSTP